MQSSTRGVELKVLLQQVLLTERACCECYHLRVADYDMHIWRPSRRCLACRFSRVLDGRHHAPHEGETGTGVSITGGRRAARS